MQRGHKVPQDGKLRRRRARTAVDSDHPGTIIGALAGEHSSSDGRAGTRERQKRHRKVRLLDRQRERTSDLIAVQRAMAGGIHPPRAVPRPVFAGERARWSVFARSIVAIASPAWSIILAAAAKAPEAEAAF